MPSPSNLKRMLPWSFHWLSVRRLRNTWRSERRALKRWVRCGCDTPLDLGFGDGASDSNSQQCTADTDRISGKGCENKQQRATYWFSNQWAIVRHKSRWLLVAVETEERVNNFPPPPENEYWDASSRPLIIVDKKWIYHAIRMIMQDSFGISVAGIIEEIQVGLYNPETRLAMIKEPRDHSDL